MFKNIININVLSKSWNLPAMKVIASEAFFSNLTILNSFGFSNFLQSINIILINNIIKYIKF